MNTQDYLIAKHQVDLNDKPPYLLARRRWKYFPLLFRDLGFTTGAEVGVQAGQFSKQLCQIVPDLKLYSIDAWLSFGWYAEHTKYDQERMEATYQEAVTRLALYNCEVIRGLSQEVAGQFEDESLDFVFLDADHDFLPLYQDISVWSEKVRPGGIVSGHDYFNSRIPGRCLGKEVVNVWTRNHGIDVWFVIVGSNYPSWFWVK